MSYHVPTNAQLDYKSVEEFLAKFREELAGGHVVHIEAGTSGGSSLYDVKEGLARSSADEYMGCEGWKLGDGSETAERVATETGEPAEQLLSRLLVTTYDPVLRNGSVLFISSREEGWTEHGIAAPVRQSN